MQNLIYYIAEKSQVEWLNFKKNIFKNLDLPQRSISNQVRIGRWTVQQMASWRRPILFYAD